MGVTLKDISKMSGYSISTVSRALNNSSLISKKTKNEISKVAKSFNFQFNQNARNLVKKNSKRIGILFPSDYSKYNRSNFFNRLQDSLFNEAQEKGYSLIIYSLSKDRGEDKVNSIVNSREIDGIIFATRDINETEIKIIKKSKLSHVFLYYKPQFLKETERLFTVDNRKTGYNATKFLIEQNCKKILTITNNNLKLKDYRERTKGYLEAVKEYGLNPLVLKTETSFENSEILLKEKFDIFKNIDGIFCQQDKMALGLIQGLKKRGINVPKDIKMIGHDDMEICSYFSPKLTTIKQPLEQLCSNAFNYLMVEIKKESKKEIENVLKSKIIIRET